MNYKASALQEFGENIRPRPQFKVIINDVTQPAKNIDKINDIILRHRDNGRRLARSLLRRWNVRMASDETDSVVDVALCEAAHRFSEDYGASFMTFLYYHLRGHLVRAVTSAAQANNIFLVFADSIAPGEWKPTAEDVANWLAPELVEQRQAETDNPEHLLIMKEDHEQCSSALNKLDALEKEVIVRSYLNQEALVDIAKSLGYSRCHISRVKRRALENLQNIVRVQNVVTKDVASPNKTNVALGRKLNNSDLSNSSGLKVEDKVEQKGEKPAFTLRIAKVERTQSNSQKRRGRRRRIINTSSEHKFLAKTA